MSGSDKESILMRVSEFLSKAVNDLAEAHNTVAREVTEFQQSLKKVREDLKTAQVTAVTTSSVPLLAPEATTTSGVATGSLFDFLEGDEAAITTAETPGMAESILLGDTVSGAAALEAPVPAAKPPTAPSARPPKAPPSAPPTVPPTAPPKAAPKVPAAKPPSAPPAAAPPSKAPAAPPPMPAAPMAAPAVPAPAPGGAKPTEGIATLRSEMMAEIKRIKEIFES